MNTVILLSVILVTCQLSLAKKDQSSILFFASQSNSKCSKPGLQCRDCESIQFCSFQQESLFAVKCKDQNKLRPYCDPDTNSCVEEKPALCPVEEPAFVCPGIGVYPDLENCKNYYICDEERVPTNYQCSFGFVYNHTIKSCSPGFFCKTYSSKTGLCKSKINKLIAYAPNNNLYLLCLANRQPLLFECPNKGDTFNEEEVVCKFECHQNGYFPYYPDPTKFYYCIQSGKKFVQSLLQCPVGTVFVEIDEAQGICSYKPQTTETTPRIEEEITTTESPVDEDNLEEHTQQNVVTEEDLQHENQQSNEENQQNEEVTQQQDEETQQQDEVTQQQEEVKQQQEEVQQLENQDQQQHVDENQQLDEGAQQSENENQQHGDENQQQDEGAQQSENENQQHEDENQQQDEGAQQSDNESQQENNEENRKEEEMEAINVENQDNNNDVLISETTDKSENEGNLFDPSNDLFSNEDVTQNDNNEDNESDELSIF